MLKRTILYAAVIAVVAAVVMVRDGGAPEPSRLLLAVLLTILFGWLVWLRWDWAPERHRRRRGKQRSAPPPNDVSTGEAERP